MSGFSGAFGQGTFSWGPADRAWGARNTGSPHSSVFRGPQAESPAGPHGGC